MAVKDAREKTPRASDPGELLELVRTAEEEATIAARDRPSYPEAIPLSSSDVLALDAERPSGDVLEVGEEVLEEPACAPSPAAVSATSRTEAQGTSWPPVATVVLLVVLAIATLALITR
jgi:hypothetical protein